MANDPLEHGGPLPGSGLPHDDPMAATGPARDDPRAGAALPHDDLLTRAASAASGESGEGRQPPTGALEQDPHPTPRPRPPRGGAPPRRGGGGESTRYRPVAPRVGGGARRPPRAR
ncbi:hypothetical protein ACFXGX_19040, partial [Streptomyces sp. NPDC059371]